MIYFSSCSSSDNNSEISVKSITDTRWVLRTLNDTKVFTPESGKDIYILLEKGSNEANGSGGCNNFFASYTISGEFIKFGPVASTEMFCENSMDTEKDFFKVLEKTSLYRIKNNFLYLSDVTGVIAKLEAVDLNQNK